ncbi:hypothetical protein KQI86_10595 [Clostridium sp. MSJ-11]|uniref:DUF4834 domain-containing protein n=1 Tax=Clostridium mobile TaxID=2841512 RepID=A0ABS6EIB9_9CLOT|nr:hypothetical protein [Clostridium mobile]MBU5484783.1 hypothetical protein [Clostridium mobile]
MDFIKILLIIGVIVIAFQFFIWMLPIIVAIWGAIYLKKRIDMWKIKNKGNRVNEGNQGAYYHHINTTDELEDKKVVDVEYEEL